MSISEVAVQQFTDNIYFQFQQEGTKLRGTTRERSCTGTTDLWDLIAPTAALQKTVRHSATPLVNSAFFRRMAMVKDWEWADLIDKQDKIRVLIDPQSSLTKNGSMALARAFDKAIISAMDADSLGGEDGSAKVTFASECAGDHNFAIAPLSLDKIIAVKKDLDDNDVPQEDRHIILPPAGFKQLLSQSSAPNVTSSDYAAVKALVKGKIDFFLGFTFHQSTLLPRPFPDIRYGYAWHFDAMAVSVGADLITEVTERADLGYSTQVLIASSFGAVRVQGPGVVRFSISESK